MPRKSTQQRLLPKLEPIRDSDALTFADLAPGYAYRCQCGHHAETWTPLPAVVCTRCGAAMKPEPEGSTPERKTP